jgi:MFS family permease
MPMSETSSSRIPVPRWVGISNRRALIGLYIGAALLYWIALYLYVPTLPTYAQTKTDDLALIGTMLSMYGLWQAIIRVPVGIAADWVGLRKPFLIGGLLLVALGPWVMRAAIDIDGLILGRAITGLAAGTWVPMVVLFSGLFPPEESVRASALLTLISTVGRIAATSLTGSLNNLGGYGLAFALAAVAALLAVAIIVPTHEERRAPKQPSLRGLAVLATRRDVLLPTLLSTIATYASWATTYGFVPILAKEMGATDVIQSLLMTFSLVLTGLGNLAATTIVQRIGAKRLLYASFVLVLLGSATLALAPSLAVLFLAQAFLGFSIGIAYPVTMGLSIRHVSDAERTTAMGLHQAIYAIGMFAGPALSGVLAKSLGMRPMFGITAFACLAGGLALTRLLDGKRE